jgi:chemotaxis methyl-accepting protein methylase
MQLTKIELQNNFNIYNCKKNIKQNNIKPNNYYSNNLSKYSADNLKANYLVNFKGFIKDEISPDSNIGALICETHFFREPHSDEIVQNYILNNFSNDPEINIVSGACSIGEEAKSYAMMLDSMGDRLHIFGFDISDEVIKQADDKVVKLIIDANLPAMLAFAHNLNFISENFLTDDNLELTPYLKKCKEKFKIYYDKSGKTHKLPIYPNVQKELNELNKLINNKEKYEEARSAHYEHLKELKEKPLSKETDEIDLFDCFSSFDDALNWKKSLLKEQAKMSYTLQDYKEKTGFDNCKFEQGDVLNLEKLYPQNSINVLLYRNALYHTLCHGDSRFRLINEDAQETMDSIARQMNKVVKSGGLVVFGENEWMQGIDCKIVAKSMEKNGFRKYIHNGYEKDNIWVKVEDLN